MCETTLFFFFLLIFKFCSQGHFLSTWRPSREELVLTDFLRWILSCSTTWKSFPTYIFFKLSVTKTWPRLVRNSWSTICRISSTPTPSPSPSHAPAYQGWISNASTKLISVHLLKIDISPSLQSWYQPISSCSNRLIFPLPTGTVETSQVLATKIGRADWWQIRLEAFLTEFTLTLFFIGSSAGCQCSNCPSVQQRYTGSKHDQYFLWSCK